VILNAIISNMKTRTVMIATLMIAPVMAVPNPMVMILFACLKD
jgi:hypothetical protein